ncbi:MAG: polysaccharide pyruvyl transferase family protein, partial [Asgard group archaeon]
MKFLITNMTGFKNKGCEATTKAIVNGITNLEKNARFKSFTGDPEYDALWMTKNKKVSFLTEPFRGLYFKGHGFFPGCWQYQLINKLGISTPIRRGMEAFRWGDAILSTGGDIFSSTYGDLSKHLTLIQIALRFKKPVILVGHSIGPFEKEREYEAFTKTMRNVQLITVRESLSFEYLRSINLKSTKIELTADP